ncbi:MAG: regulator of replication initiation timing [Flavobacteriales bacterium]|jgi:regulator of replication initiation timing
MSEINQLAQERQRLMQDFLSVKTQLAKAREENETLRQQNTKLNIAIEEREIEFANLFSYVQSFEN